MACIIGFDESTGPTMRVVDLFCGAGGLSLGLQRAGMELVAAFDQWPEAVAVYRRNLGDHAHVADLADVMRIAPRVMDYMPDAIVGGPPCQDFSSAGARREGERAELLTAWAMIVAIARPPWVLLENVPRARKSQAYARARAILVRAGYGLTETVVDASWYGVAQTRRRLVVIGRLGEADGSLSSAIEAARYSRRTTIREVLGDDVGGEIWVHPRTYGRRGLWDTNAPGPTVRESSRRPIPPGYGREAAGFVYVRPYGDGDGVRSIDEPAPAIVRVSRERPPRRARDRDGAALADVPCLTQAQTSALQGFPKEWDWTPAGTKRAADQMIANAVPAPLAEALGRAIMDRHRGETIPGAEDAYAQWLRTRGIVGQVARNRRSQLNRARRLLGGRVIQDLAEEIATLEAVTVFQALSASVRSDLRAALRMHHEWRTTRDRTNHGCLKR